MNSPNSCRTCGTNLTADSPEGLCPKCLLVGGLALLGRPPSALSAGAPTHASAPGTPFTATKLHYFGDYELLEEIARGGMGMVFKARQISLNRVVALKLISGGTLATEDLVKRFKSEAEAAASLSHPNIVPIYEIGEHQGQHYFSMGLIDGPNLHQEISDLNSQITNPRMNVQLVATIAHAVHYAHQRGVLHRDIKPSNILLDAQREPHLTDFGLAKLVEKESTLTHTHAVLGTPAYMAPEQARGNIKQVTTAADVYGLGAVLYEALTGSPPFGGGTSLETIHQVLDQEPRRPSLWNPAVDRDLETICLKCLEKEPNRRYGSAQALVDDLDHWLNSEPISARSVSNYERLKKWVRRRPAIAGLGTLSLVSLLALSIGSTVAAFRIDAAKKAEAEERKKAVDTAKTLRLNLYGSDMSVAFQTWETGDAGRPRTLLTNQIPRASEDDLRGWEWRYLWSRTRPQELDEWRCSDASVMSLAYSPDGQDFVTGPIPLQLWEAASRRPVDRFAGDYEYGYTIAISTNGNLFLSTHAYEKTVRVWDARKRQLLGTFTNHTQLVYSAAFVPNGNAIVSTGGRAYGTSVPGELKLWDVRTFQELGDFEHVDFPLIRCDVSADGRLVAGSGGGPVVQIWDLNSRKLMKRFTGHETKSKGMVAGLRFSPDGRFLATGDFGGTVRLWNTQTSEAVVLGSHRQPVVSLAFSPDGTRLASSSYDQTVKLWNVAHPGEWATLRGHSTRVWCVAFAPDGKTLASGEEDGTVKFWSASLPSEDNIFAQSDALGQVGYSADGRFLAWEGSRVITVRDLAKSNAEHRLEGWDFAFSPTGNLLAVIRPKGPLQLWSLDPFAELPVPPEIEVPAQMLVYSRNSDRLAALSPQGDIVVWALPGWQEQARIKAGLGDTHLFFTPDGESLLSAGPTNEIIQWRIATGQRIGTFRGHSSVVTAASISPDGRLLATGSKDTTVRLWDVPTRREVAKLVAGVGSIRSLAFSKDGKTIAAGSYEGTIQLWNVASRQQVGALQGHVSFVHSLAFSPDGNTLASSSMDNTLRLWKAASWDEVGRAAMRQP